MTSDASARILVVDDDPYVCALLSRWLSAEGHACAEASNAEEAAAALRQDAFSLVILDIRMPGLSGMDLLAQISDRHEDVAVIMVTAVDDRSTAIRALELGAYGYLIKPFDKNEVIINVVNALARRRLTLESRDYGRRLEEQVRERTADVHRSQAEIILRLMSASEYRDDETGAHIRRIGLYVAAMAEKMDWKRSDVDAIRLAAPMHDLGKIGVKDSILLKPGKLTAEEFEIVKTHSAIGARILSGTDIPLLTIARDVALLHHEKWDGSGYPNGVAGKAIPECARLVAIADVYDALVNDRVYRPAFPEEKAIAIMTEERGRHFDPEIFDLFLSVLPELRHIREIVGYAGTAEDG